MAEEEDFAAHVKEKGRTGRVTEGFEHSVIYGVYTFRITKVFY